MATIESKRNLTGILIDLFRPWGMATVIFLLVATQTSDAISNYGYLALVFSVSAVLLTVVGGYCFNDYCDSKIDLIVHPERVIPSGRLARFTVLLVALGAFVLAIGAYYAARGSGSLLFGIGLIVLVLAYSPLKGVSGFLGNVVMALLPFLVVIYGYSLTGQLTFDASVALFACTVFFAILSQEVVRDVEDVTREINTRRRTLPMQIGTRRTLRLTACLFSVALISVVGFLFSENRVIALMLTTPAFVLGLLIVRALWCAVQSPTHIVRMMKVVMTWSVVIMALVRL